MPLRPLVLLQVGFLAEEDPAGDALEGAHTLVDALVHVAVAGGGEDLAARLARVLPLLALPAAAGAVVALCGPRPLAARGRGAAAVLGKVFGGGVGCKRKNTQIISYFAYKKSIIFHCYLCYPGCCPWMLTAPATPRRRPRPPWCTAPLSAAAPPSAPAPAAPTDPAGASASPPSASEPRRGAF